MVSVTVTKTFGYKHLATGFSYTNWAKDIKTVCKFTLADSATLSKISVYGMPESGTMNVMGLIYSDNNGVPNTLVGATSETVVNAADGYKPHDLSFAAPLALNPGTYWVGFFHDGAVNWYSRYTTGSTNQTATASDDYTDGPSESFGTPSYADRVYPFFATYTTTVNMTYPPSLEGKTVTTVTTDETVRWQEKSFAAANRIWVFYVENSTGYYTSSADDGVTWTTPVSLGGTIENLGENLQAILEVKGSDEYVHVFKRGLYYRRGLLNSDGTITWTANWNNFWTSGASFNVDFYAMLDSNGYPWVTWGYANSPENMVPYINKSSRNDGIWETAAGYPLALTATVTGRCLTNNFIVSLSNGKLYAFYFGARKTGASNPTANTGLIYGKLWNGVAWGSEETATSSAIMCQYNTGYETYSRGVAVDSDDNIHLVFLDEKYPGSTTYSSFSWSIRYVKRTWGTGWGTEQVVEPDILYKNASPSMTLYGEDIRIFWTGSPSPDIIFTKILDPGGWWSGAIYLIDETTDTIPNVNSLGYDGVINPFPKMYENKLGFLYVTGSSSPYTIKFTFEKYEEYLRVYKKTYSKTNTSDFDHIVNAFENVGGSLDVTLRTLTLGDRDSTTGLYAKNYADSTIKMFITPKGSITQMLGVGYYAVLDAVGFTKEPVNIYDHIVDASNRTWEIKTVTPAVIGDELRFWVCDLKEVFVL